MDKSLLQAIEATDQGSTLRFRMLETIREYGVERLGERAELSRPGWPTPAISPT